MTTNLRNVATRVLFLFLALSPVGHAGKTKPTFEDLVSNLLGTWTLQTHASSDLGYYKGSAFVVMHVMENPTQAYSCKLSECSERVNKICQQDQCIDIDSNIVEWSDGKYK